MERVYQIQINTTDVVFNPTPEFFLNDKNILEFSMYSGPDQLDMGDKTMVVLFTKSDGKKVIANAVITGFNTARYEVGTNDLLVGTTDVTVQIYQGSDRVTNRSFKVTAKADPNDGTAVESTTEYPILTGLIANARQVLLNEDDRVAAEDTRTQNETTRVINESLRDTAESARSSNESARVSAETARNTAESARANAESIRSSSESARVTAEGTRVTAEGARASAESTRISSETGRSTAEVGRASAESSRVTAESARATAESNRSTAEATRASAESSRVSSESARQSSESTRAVNERTRTVGESTRVASENLRETHDSDIQAHENTRNTNENIRIDNELERIDNENTRKSAETAREAKVNNAVSTANTALSTANSVTTAESSRVTAESNRVTAETARVTAEGNRVTAESARVTADGNRTSAETARVSAENARVGAENSRVTAENTRNTNETSRYNAESARVGAENARASAENTRNGAEASRINAESTRGTNESNRIASENQRASNESTRISNEANRVSDERTRSSNEDARVYNEDSRSASESDRQYMEDGRQSAESSRVTNESARAGAESTRVSHEDARISAENARASAESTRVSSENTRVSAESTRVSNDSQREANELIRLQQESARTTNEQQRVTAEQSRTAKMQEAIKNVLLQKMLDIVNTKDPINLTTEVDAQHRITKQTYTRQSNGTKSSETEYGNFDANGNPQSMTQREYDPIGKGVMKLTHSIAFDQITNNILSDTTALIPSDTADLVVTRNTPDIDPLTLYNPTSSTIKTYAANVLSGQDNSYTERIANNDTTLEIIGDKVYTPFSTGRDEEVSVTKMPFIGGDTLTATIDPATKVANSVAECPMKVFKGNIDPTAIPLPTVSFKNELVYTPATWAEWTKTNCTVDSTGAQFNESPTTRANIYIAPANPLKVNTKYGLLFNVVSNTSNTSYYCRIGGKTIDNIFPVGSAGNIKVSATTLASLTDGIMVISDGGYATVSGAMKLKDVRLFELPAGSQIEWDFNNLTADQLAAAYSFDSTGKTQTGMSAAWQEITDQKTIDKLKVQNEMPITSVDLTARTAVVNGKNYVKQASNKPALIDDFAGKTVGDVTGNPHKGYMRNGIGSTTLYTPSSLPGEGSSSFYNLISIGPDGNSYPTDNTGNGCIPQQLFSFNLIEALDRKYGVPGTTLAEKIDWCKKNIGKLQLDWFGYGFGPNGNKANLQLFEGVSNSWMGLKTNTANAPSNINPVLMPQLYGGDKNFICNDGFLHALAYADAAKQLVNETNYDPNTWAEWAKPAGVTADNGGMTITADGITWITSYINSNLKPSTKYGCLYSVVSSNITKGLIIGGGGLPFNTTGPYAIGNNKTSITSSGSFASNKVQLGVYNNEPTGNSIKLKNFRVIELPAGSQIETDFNTLTADQLDAKYPFGALPVVQSTIYTDYIDLQVWLKDTPGYDTLVPVENTRDQGQGTVVLLKKSYDKITTDFVGKVKADMTNPNSIGYTYGSPTLVTPSTTMSEFGTPDYTQASTQDGTVINVGGNTAGNIPQQRFTFDLIKNFEKLYGTIPSGQTTAEKVDWLRKNLSKLTASWTGYGAANGVNKAYLTWWNATAWVLGWNNTASSPNALTPIILFPSGAWCQNSLDDNGMVNLLAYTDAVATNDKMVYLTGHGITNGIIENTTRNVFVSSAVVNTNLLSMSSIAGQTVGDSIRKYQYYSTKTAGTGSTSSTIYITAHGLVTGDAVTVNGRGYSRITVIDADSFTLDTSINGVISGDTVYLGHYIGTQTAELAPQGATIYTDYVKLDMEFKPRVWGTVTDDFAGKTSGSTAAVPHIAKWTTYNGVVSSTSIFNTELNDGYYDQIETNGSGGEFGIGSSAVDGYVPQMLVLFDVIRLFEDTWGTIPSAQDTASKVQWLKDNGNKIVINWYGYCVNSSGGGGTAYMKFATSGGTAFDDTSIVSRGGSLTSGLMTQNTTAFSRMDSNGMFPVLVYGEPGASTGQSILRTDYISITLEMKADTTGVDFFGENSIQLTETTTKGRSPAYLVEYDLSALATALTGWTTASPNNQAFKDLLKAITAEVWAMGTGTDASVMEKTRADFIVFNATNNSYTNQGSFGSTRWSASNIAGQVAKINNVNASTDTNSASMAQQQTTTGNKLYLLVYTPLTSDPANNIQASVSLDFVKLSVDLKRTSDTITGIPIYLPDEWTALVR